MGHCTRDTLLGRPRQKKLVAHAVAISKKAAEMAVKANHYFISLNCSDMQNKSFSAYNLSTVSFFLYTVQRGLALRELLDRESKTALDRIPR